MMSAEDILSRPAPPPSARLSYGPDPEQFGDLRLPEGAGPHPVVVALHGGYWRAKYDLEYLGHMCAALAAVGVATWNVEYRRVGNPGGGWPGTFADVGRAIDHLRALGAPHHQDLSRVVGLGHSAGGHLALWAAGRHRIPAGAPMWSDAPLALRGVVALAGVCDLRRAWALHLSDDAAPRLLGGAPEDVPERYAAASPAELLPLGVRQVLIHGTADEDVPYSISQEYHAAAVAAGDAATLITLPGAGHFEVVDPATAEWSAVRDAILALVGAGRV
jgi:acetyl esterase/lipase